VVAVVVAVAQTEQAEWDGNGTIRDTHTRHARHRLDIHRREDRPWVVIGQRICLRSGYPFWDAGPSLSSRASVFLSFSLVFSFSFSLGADVVRSSIA